MSQTVQQNLGFKEIGVPTALESNGEQLDLQRVCLDLETDRDKLRADLKEVMEERDAYLKALKAALPEKEFSFTKDELLSQVGKLPPLEDLISELRKEVGK
jgi:hypothetical protein